MNNKHLEATKAETTKDDVFGAHLLKGAEYDLESGWDIPYVDTPESLSLPEQLVGYNKSAYCESRETAYLHFYHKDHIFDGRMGIWFALVFNTFFKKGFKIEKLNGYRAIITPDFSMYYDMPIIMQMWNLFRSRVVGYYLTKLGYNVVVNVRWTDSRSYGYCFAGLRKNHIVAVSTLGCLRSNADKQLFLPGLEEFIKRIHPEYIILYGSLTPDIKRLFAKYKQQYVFFPSEISEIHGGGC